MGLGLPDRRLWKLFLWAFHTWKTTRKKACPLNTIGKSSVFRFLSSDFRPHAPHEWRSDDPRSMDLRVLQDGDLENLRHAARSEAPRPLALKALLRADAPGP